jgi:hypothetical protein
MMDRDPKTRLWFWTGVLAVVASTLIVLILALVAERLA